MSPGVITGSVIGAFVAILIISFGLHHFFSRRAHEVVYRSAPHRAEDRPDVSPFIAPDRKATAHRGEGDAMQREVLTPLRRLHSPISRSDATYETRTTTEGNDAGSTREEGFWRREAEALRHELEYLERGRRNSEELPGYESQVSSTS
ncbi:hypothetical protein SCHPADRAFT_899497 [Schizopora paradoxa]|uniref:Uncharacterized protein n=1 Tax=Schizopora paradoxa TaxID=27342 RepID=A0A0H2SAG2_9AGAM|nr:hypothetical protein SCHPADRAFT_899497 [Schizopora paradoxa]